MLSTCVDGKPGYQCPEVRATDEVAVFLVDGFELSVHDGGVDRPEGDEARIGSGGTQAAVGAQQVCLCDVDLGGIVESQANSLAEDAGSYQVVGRGSCRRKQRGEVSPDGEIRQACVGESGCHTAVVGPLAERERTRCGDRSRRLYCGRGRCRWFCSWCECGRRR